MIGTHSRTVVAVYRQADDALAAVRQLDRDHLSADHVGIVAGDAELAGQVGGHTYALAGAICGFSVGMLVSALFVGLGGPSFASDVPGVVLGAIFVSFGMGFIGSVFGGAVVKHTAHRETYERAVAQGGAVVTVECDGVECDHARHVLEISADEVFEEV